MEFHCKYTIYGIPCNYACKVEKVVKICSASSAILIIGQHLEGKSNADVKVFKMTNQPLDAFPRNLHEKFPNLTRLWIFGCGLKQISRTDLIGLENLEYLDLRGNNLTSLPDDLFADMKKLRRVYFNNNKLERLSSKLLKPIIKSLKFAYFSENTKINDYFHNDIEGKKNIKRLMDIMDTLEPPLPEDPLFELKGQSKTQHDQHQQVFAKFVEFKASGEFTDFSIKVRGKEFKVHKAVLAAQSPVFRQTFTNDDGTTEKTFTKVKSFSEKSFENFLDFFYTGKIGDEVNALEVFELASVFEVSILKKISVDKITATLSEGNALEVFNLGCHHDSDQLKEQAFKVIKQMLPELPDKTVDNPEQVNKLVTIKREFDVMLEATKKLYVDKNTLAS